MKLEEYKKQFPGAPTISESMSAQVSKQISKRNKESWKDTEYRESMREMRADANKKNWKKKDYRTARTAEAKERFSSEEFLDSVREIRRKTGKKVLTERWSSDDGTMKRRASKQLENWWQNHRDEALDSVKRTWESSEFRKKIAEAVSAANKERWKNPEFRQKIISAVKAKWEDSVYRAMMSERAKETCIERWKDPAFKEKWIKAIKENWKDPDYRERMSKEASERMTERLLLLWATKTDIMLARTRTYRSGYGTRTPHTSPKAGSFTTRSKLEAAFAKQLDEDDNVVYYEYESVKVPYIFEDKEHTYIVDFYIITIDGKEHHIELKPDKFSTSLQTESKWDAAKSTLPNFSVMHIEDYEFNETS